MKVEIELTESEVDEFKNFSMNIVTFTHVLNRIRDAVVSEDARIDDLEDRRNYEAAAADGSEKD